MKKEKRDQDQNRDCQGAGDPATKGQDQRRIASEQWPVAKEDLGAIFRLSEFAIRYSLRRIPLIRAPSASAGSRNRPVACAPGSEWRSDRLGIDNPVGRWAQDHCSSCETSPGRGRGGLVQFILQGGIP